MFSGSTTNRSAMLPPFLGNGDSTTWDSRLGCLRAGILPALQKLDVIKSSFPGVGTSKPGLLQALTAFITWSDVVTNPKH